MSPPSHNHVEKDEADDNKGMSKLGEHRCFAKVMSNIRVVLGALPPYRVSSPDTLNPTFPIHFYECARDAYAPLCTVASSYHTILLY